MNAKTRQPSTQRPRSAGRIAIFLFILSVCCSSVPLASAQHDVHAALVPKADRKTAPAFQLADSKGRSVKIGDDRGKVVLLNFWATKCGGCVLEIPYYIAIQQAYEKSGFTAIGISADIPYEGLKSPDEAWRLVRPFITSHKINYPIVMGDNSIISAYGFESYPATYLIDKTGRIAASYVGVVSKEDVEANIKTLLAER